MMHTPNYEKDKSGWVTFNVNKPKVKLRRYISDLAKQLTKFGIDNYHVNRGILIDYYNQDGIEGLHRVMRLKLLETKERIN